MTGCTKKSIRLSVIVCAYNEEKQLENCLASLLKQEFDPSEFEIIIMDNESSDSTPIIAKRIVEDNQGKVQIRYLRIKHVGLSISRNSGISEARGNIIAFVDADACVGKGWIKNIVSPFDNDPSISILAGRVLNLNDDVWFSRFIYQAHYSAGAQARSNTKIGGLTGANMAFRRRVFDVTGGFFDGFASYGDETSVAVKYLDNHPDEVVAHTQDAIVFNEHPETLYRWLRQRFFQGRMLFLINMHVAKSSAQKTALKACVKFLGLFCLFIILLDPVINFSAGIIFVAVALFLATIYTRLKYLLGAYRKVSSSFSWLFGAAGVMTCIIGNICSDAGFVIEAFMALTGKKVALGNSVSKVIESR